MRFDENQTDYNKITIKKDNEIIVINNKEDENETNNQDGDMEVVDQIEHEINEQDPDSSIEEESSTKTKVTNRGRIIVTPK